MKFCYINDKLILEDEASISIKERGFRFGDGVFETISIKNTRLVDFELHLERLKLALEEVLIIYDISALKEKAAQLISKNKQIEGFLRLSISRGIGSVGYRPCEDIKPLLIIETEDARKQDKKDLALLISKYKKTSTQSLPTGVKLMQGLNSTLAFLEAKNAGYDDGLLLNEKNNICETSCANIFFIKNDKIYTPPVADSLVAGIIRKKIIENFTVIEKSINVKKIRAFDGAFISNTALTIKKIKTIDGYIYKKNVENIFTEIENYLFSR